MSSMSQSRVVSLLASRFNFAEEEALLHLKCYSERGRPACPLPFVGVVQKDWCCGVRKNHDLYSQCTNVRVKDSMLCKTCGKTKMPKYGMIEDRMQESVKNGSVIGHYNGSKIAHYGNVMEKLSLDKDTVIRELKKYFGDDVVIPEEIWEAPKARRGRPKGSTKKSAATSDTDEEKPKKKRGRPSKKVVEESNDGDDLISQLVKGAATDSSDGDGAPIVEKPAKKTAKKRAKKALSEEEEAQMKADKKAKAEATRLANLQTKWRAKASDMGKEGAEIDEFVQSETEKRAARLQKTQEAKVAKTKKPEPVAVEELTAELPEEEADEEEADEEEADEEEGDEEGELSVEPQTIGGKEYLVDPETKQVFDADAEEAVPIGIWNEEDDCVDAIEE